MSSESSIVNSALGPVIVAVVLNSVLYGICCLQFFEYATTTNRDSRLTKWLVAWIAIVDTFSVCNSASLLWHYAVDNFGNIEVLVQTPWQYNLLSASTALASVPIQLFLGWRVKSLSNSWALYGVICILSLAEGGMALAVTIAEFEKSNLSEHPLLVSIVVGFVSITTACDVIIAGSLIYCLQATRTGFKRTDFTIRRLVRTTIETAVPAAICCILLLIAVTVRSTSNLSVIFGLLLGRIYTNTLMTTLNARAAIRRERDDLPTGTMGMGVIFATHPGTLPPGADDGPTVSGGNHSIAKGGRANLKGDGF
ncbi:hypothetical protein DFH06DRAFT_1328807 [Mycena polygramma]|nr:hypothetical protein DFH06DRAFT_1328807 [Mycena polygramma]